MTTFTDEQALAAALVARTAINMELEELREQVVALKRCVFFLNQTVEQAMGLNPRYTARHLLIRPSGAPWDCDARYLLSDITTRYTAYGSGMFKNPREQFDSARADQTVLAIHSLCEDGAEYGPGAVQK